MGSTMGLRKSLGSDVPETNLPAILEKRPLLDPSVMERSPLSDCATMADRGDLRGWSSVSSSRSSLYRSFAYKGPSKQTNHRSRTRSSKSGAKFLNSDTEDEQPKLQSTGREAPLRRSQSAPWLCSSHSQPYPCLQRTPQSYRASPQHPCQIRSSPQYRVNPVLKFNERLLPERMNYGIAGYNTSRRHKSSMSSTSVFESNMSSRTIQPSRVLKSREAWTRRFLKRMSRSRVRVTCSRLLNRFKRRASP